MTLNMVKALGYSRRYSVAYKEVYCVPLAEKCGFLIRNMIIVSLFFKK